MSGNAAACRRYRERHPERVRKNRRKFYARHKNGIAKKFLRKYHADPDRHIENVKRYRAKRPASYMLSCARSRAKQRGHDCTLTEEWIERRLPLGCELSGLPFDLEAAGGRGRHVRPMVPSIDRIDSSKGYTPENCRLVCWAINAAARQWGWDAVAPILKAAIAKESEHQGRSLHPVGF